MMAMLNLTHIASKEESEALLRYVDTVLSKRSPFSNATFIQYIRPVAIADYALTAILEAEEKAEPFAGFVSTLVPGKPQDYPDATIGSTFLQLTYPDEIKPNVPVLVSEFLSALRNPNVYMAQHEDPAHMRVAIVIAPGLCITRDLTPAPASEGRTKAVH